MRSETIVLLGLLLAVGLACAPPAGDLSAPGHVDEQTPAPLVVTADAGGPYSFAEGMAGTLSATANGSTGAGAFRWDFEDDGVWDTVFDPNSTATHTWPDDWAGGARVEVQSRGPELEAPSNVGVYQGIITFVGYQEDRAQSFIAETDQLTAVRIDVSITDVNRPPAGLLSVSIRDNLTGPDLIQAEIPRDGMPGTQIEHWVRIDFGGGLPLTKGGLYYLVLRSSGNPPAHLYEPHVVTDAYAGGMEFYKNDPLPWASDPTSDLRFAILGSDVVLTMDVAQVTVSNVAPVLESSLGDPATEGEVARIAATVTDPGTDDLTLSWLAPTGETRTHVSPSSGSPRAVTDAFEFLPGDDGDLPVALRIEDDNGGVTELELTLSVSNAPPQVTLSSRVAAAGRAALSLRVAGEKFHDLSATVLRNGVAVSGGAIVRRPGSPDDQLLFLGNITAVDTVKIVYSPLDDPVNGRVWGATPAWLILTQGGNETRLHHTFNARHDDTWVWTVDLSAHLPPSGVELTATATDPGSDDLTLTIDWGDGVRETLPFLNDPAVGADPHPSPELHPRTITAAANHDYAPGAFTIVVTVEDDDGGMSTATVSVVI